MTDGGAVRISVIIPCFQEARFIARCLDSIIGGDFDFAASGSEIFVIDGMSDDGSRDIIADYAHRYDFVRMLDNPDKIQVKALNIGLRQASGDLIFRCDAHSEYPRDYFPVLIEHHAAGLADNIGVRCDSVPGDDGRVARAIAAVLSSPVGVGMSHRSLSGHEPLFVDTVPFGSWKREVFDRFGPYDEAFIRAQDLEHNMRIKARGAKVALLPWISVKYYSRETFRKLMQKAYQYGYWKNMVNKKHRLLSTKRQLFPPALVVFMVLSPLLMLEGEIGRPVALAGWAVYLTLIAAASLVDAWRLRDPLSWPLLVAAYFCLHTAYGVGYLAGLFNVVIRSRFGLSDMLTRVTR